MTFLATLLGMALGIAAGVLLAPLFDRITEHRKRINLLKHLSYDLSNASRHFGYVIDEMPDFKNEDDPYWKAISRLNWMRLSTKGLLTYNKDDLYTLKTLEADKLMEIISLLANFDELCRITSNMKINQEALIGGVSHELGRRAHEIELLLDEFRPMIQSAISKWRWYRLNS